MIKAKQAFSEIVIQEVTVVTKKFAMSLLLRNYDVITCILDDA